MARNTERRRRVMKEEVLSASFAAYNGNSQEQEIEPGDTPRYGAGANIENHPQITDFVPRQFRKIGLVAMVGLAVGLAAGVLAHFAPVLSQWTPSISVEEIRTVFADRLLAWTSATMLLMTACGCRLIYSLRRHRVDDSRGRYRIWRIASWASVLLSMNAVVGIHEPVARAMGSLTEWSFLPGSAAWWLIPSAILGLWLLTKLMMDVAESRTSLLTYGMAILCFGLASAFTIGWSPERLAEFSGLAQQLLPYGANLLLLTGTLLYARYVVLDVQGLIEHAPVEKTSSTVLDSTPEADLAAEPVATASATKPQSESSWVDGSEPESDEEAPRAKRLSKAERKRLRKQKNQQRAA